MLQFWSWHSRDCFDIAGAATDAVDHLAAGATARVKVASIDPEVFFDFTQQRPIVSLDGSGGRVLQWPENDAYELTLDGAVSSLITISGVEPHLRWRTFAQAVGEIAQRAALDSSSPLALWPDRHPIPEPWVLSGRPATRCLLNVWDWAAPPIRDQPALSGPSMCTSMNSAWP